MNGPEGTQDRTGSEGIRLGRFHAIVAVVFSVLALLLLLSTILTGRWYSRMEEATEHYIKAQQTAADMQAASDQLTTQARSFIVTGELVRAQQFIEEVDVTRRRDHVLDELEKLLDNPSAYAYLNVAKDNSDELLEIECYAMRLAAQSYGSALSELPDRLRAVILDDADLQLTAQEQREKALEMVFDQTYQDYKDTISSNVSMCVETLINETQKAQKESAAQLLRTIYLESGLIVIMLLMVLALVLSTAKLVTKPLQRYISHIRHDGALPEEGAQELRFLAHTYNQVREKNLHHRNQLIYDATHDALTGLLNRSVFEKLRARASGRDNAMLIFDFDRFKNINDQFGHDAGDRALCYVATLLQDNFRAEDYICRIGGDEFAVIMVHTDSSLHEFGQRKNPANQ